VSIMLEVKKFINSEYIGQYAEIDFPVEAPEEAPKKEKKAKKPAKSIKPRKKSRDYDDYDDYDDIEAELDREEREEMGLPPLTEDDDDDYEEEYEREPQGPSYERMRIHYVEEGNGEPLILIHSISQSIYTWRNIFSRLSLNYRVIALDLPGHGFSSRPENFSYTIEEQAKAIELFMDAINIESAHIMAFSMGSAYALQLAMDHPERIGKMVLIAPGGISPEMPMPIKMLDSSLFGGVASMLYGMRTVEKVLTECYFDLTRTMSPEVVSEYYKTISDRESRRAMRESFHNYEDEPVVGRLRMLDAPVLMLQGSEDKWRTSDQSDLYHAAMPFAGFATVRNAGHLLHEEKAERVIAAILEYIPAIQPEM